MRRLKHRLIMGKGSDWLDVLVTLTEDDLIPNKLRDHTVDPDNRERAAALTRGRQRDGRAECTQR